jgi:hypothetical protein
MSNDISMSPEREYAVVDLSTDSTIVFAGSAQLVGVHIHTTISAQNCPFTDNAVSVFQIPASASTGEWYEAGNMKFVTDLTVDPDNSATGTIVVVYIKNHGGLAGTGAGLP